MIAGTPATATIGLITIAATAVAAPMIAPTKTDRFMPLKKKTRLAPAAVTSQVNVVAISAPVTGLRFSKKDIRLSFMTSAR
jgi:hypothetical protein